MAVQHLQKTKKMLVLLQSLLIKSLTEPRSQEECQVNRHAYVFAVQIVYVCLFL